MPSPFETLSNTIEKQVEKMKTLMERIGAEISKYQSIDEEKNEIILGIKITFKTKEVFKQFVGEK